MPLMTPAQRSRKPGGSRFPAFAALSIADQCFQAIDELEQVRKEVASRATNLTRRIKEEVPGSGETG